MGFNKRLLEKKIRWYTVPFPVRFTNLRFLYGKKNYREYNSSNSFLMTEYPSQLILQKISFTHH